MSAQAIIIEPLAESRRASLDAGKLAFSAVISDHMLVATMSNGERPAATRT